MPLIDRNTQLRHLEQAEQQIVQGERRIASQEARVARLASGGHSVESATQILDSFRASQALFIQHRDLIRRELEL